jgi:4-hydroxy-tetrahydrodipicolinate synthase
MSKLTSIRDRIKGPVFSILTPFNPNNDEIDFDSLDKYIHTIYKGGGRIFYVMAYNSRFSQLTFEEIKLVNEFVVKTVKQIDAENIVIVADPPHCSTRVTLEFAEHAEAVGADIISLIVRERYYFDEQIFQHFKFVNDRTNIGILIHEMPFLNGLGGPLVQWPLSLLDKVSDLSNVIAIKEDAKNDEFSAEVINLVKDRLAIIISGGGKSQWLRFENIGCQSWLNGIGVFEPRLATAFWEAWKSNNDQIVNIIVNDIEAPFFEHAIRKYGWHLTIKVALEHFNHMSSHDRMPLMPLPSESADCIRTLLDQLPIGEVLA